jgi:hypothetical protein
VGVLFTGLACCLVIKSGIDLIRSVQWELELNRTNANHPFTIDVYHHDTVIQRLSWFVLRQDVLKPHSID